MFLKISARSKHLLLRKYCYSLAQTNDYYGILDVKDDATFKQIKDKYLQKSKQYHPDRSTSAVDQYHQVQQAYKTLIDPQKRKKYDLSLGRINSAWQRQLTDTSFSSSFESQMYDEILKPQNVKNVKSNLSIEESLRKQFAQEINNFQFKQLYRSSSFIVGILGMGMLWGSWNFIEFMLLQHEGTNEHQIKISMTDTSLKIIPTFTR